MGVAVCGSGFVSSGLGFGVWGLKFGACGLGFKDVHNSDELGVPYPFRVRGGEMWGLVFRVWDLEVGISWFPDRV